MKLNNKAHFGIIYENDKLSVAYAENDRIKEFWIKGKLKDIKEVRK